MKINLAAKGLNSLIRIIMPRGVYSRTRDAVKLTVCVCVSVPAVTAQRLQCDEN